MNPDPANNDIEPDLPLLLLPVVIKIDPEDPRPFSIEPVSNIILLASSSPPSKTEFGEVFILSEDVDCK